MKHLILRSYSFFHSASANALLTAALGVWALAGCSATINGTANVDARSTGGRASSKRAPIQVRVVAGKKVVDYGDRIFEFEYDSAQLTGDETFDALLEVRDFLREHPELRIEVEGYTDSRGSEKHNLALSKKRAEAIVANLVNNGVAAKRLGAVGLGEAKAEAEEGECFNHAKPEDPIVVRTCTPRWDTSRRAELRVVE